MGAFLVAWLFGEGIIVYRSFKVQGGPPWPGQLLAGTGAFAALAILGEMGGDARKVSLTVAWGLNAAGFLALFPAAGTTYGATGTWANKVTGTDPANNGWWDYFTANFRIPDGQIFPSAGGCVPAGQEGTGTNGTVAPDKNGNCPPAYTYHNGACYPPLAAAQTTPDTSTTSPSATTPPGTYNPHIGAQGGNQGTGTGGNPLGGTVLV